MPLAANLTLLFDELPLLDRPVAACAAGFDGVEVLFPYGEAAFGLPAALRAARMPVALINTPLGPAGEPGLAAVGGREAEARAAIRAAIERATELGCRTVHVMAGRIAPEATTAVLLANLRWAIPLAREAGIVLTLEALNALDMPGYAYRRPAQVVTVLEALDSDCVRLQFDLYHVAREGLDAVAALEASRPWVHHVQAAEAPGRSAPDPAVASTRAALRRLADWPYRGWFGFEYRPAGDTPASLAKLPEIRALLRA